MEDLGNVAERWISRDGTDPKDNQDLPAKKAPRDTACEHDFLAQRIAQMIFLQHSRTFLNPFETFNN